jgi:hypothetical protein
MRRSIFSSLISHCQRASIGSAPRLTVPVALLLLWLLAVEMNDGYSIHSLMAASVYGPIVCEQVDVPQWLGDSCCLSGLRLPGR